MSTTTNNKRSLPTEGISSTALQSPSKRRKLNKGDAIDFASKLYDISKDDRINDIEFTIQMNEEIEIIRGHKAFFAAHSDVFKSMLYNGSMKESQNNKVIIDDITIEAFKFIKEYTHFANPELEYEHVIDVLYGAEKYMITNLIQKCKDKVLSMDSLGTFYLITIAINKYHTSSIFEGLFKNILKLQFIKTNVKSIIRDNRSQTLNILQIHNLIKLIVDDYDRYVTINIYCKSGSEEWRGFFAEHFQQFVNFEKLSIQQLVNVGLDDILKNKFLLSLIDAKAKEMQTSMSINNEKIESLAEDNKGLSEVLTLLGELKAENKKFTAQNRNLRAENERLKKRLYYRILSDSSDLISN